jgi:hypothetical protein
MRENFRLKNDLRVMIERATEFRDEVDFDDCIHISALHNDFLGTSVIVQTKWSNPSTKPLIWND